MFGRATRSMECLQYLQTAWLVNGTAFPCSFKFTQTQCNVFQTRIKSLKHSTSVRSVFCLKCQKSANSAQQVQRQLLLLSVLLLVTLLFMFNKCLMTRTVLSASLTTAFSCGCGFPRTFILSMDCLARGDEPT